MGRNERTVSTRERRQRREKSAYEPEEEEADEEYPRYDEEYPRYDEYPRYNDKKAIVPRYDSRRSLQPTRFGNDAFKEGVKEAVKEIYEEHYSQGIEEVHTERGKVYRPARICPGPNGTGCPYDKYIENHSYDHCRRCRSDMTGFVQGNKDFFRRKIGQLLGN